MSDSPPHSDVWCAIPVYNNAGTLRDVVARTLLQLPRVIVVDDGSTDGDPAVIVQGLPVEVIRHSHNLGKGAALLTAMRHAAASGGNYLITLDADGQHFPEDIPAFLPLLRPDVILIGHRTTVHGEMPRRSQFGREFSDLWIRMETGQTACDTQSGFRAYPLARTLGLPLRSRRYHFEVEVVTRALWDEMRVEAVPIRVWYPNAKDRVSNFRPLVDNWRISLLHLRLVATQILLRPARWPRVPLLTEHATPLGLAAAAALGVLVAALPWVVFRLVLLLLLCFRLHLNKPTALLAHALGALPIIPWLCLTLGQILLSRPVQSNWDWWPYPAADWQTWLIGSMGIGPLLATALAIITYRFTGGSHPEDA